MKQVYQIDYWLGPKYITIYATRQVKVFSEIKWERIEAAANSGNMVQIRMVEVEA